MVMGADDMASQFLISTVASTDKAVEVMRLKRQQIEVTMCARGAEKIEQD